MAWQLSKYPPGDEYDGAVAIILINAIPKRTVLNYDNINEQWSDPKGNIIDPKDIVAWELQD